MRGAGGRLGRLPGAHEAAAVGLLDMADHAVTLTDHRWRRGAILFPQLFFFLPLKVPRPINSSAMLHGSEMAPLPH